MTCSASNAKRTDDSGMKSMQDKKAEPRILPYYCSWYRTIFPCKTSASGGKSDGKDPVQVPG